MVFRGDFFWNKMFVLLVKEGKSQTLKKGGFTSFRMRTPAFYYVILRCSKNAILTRIACRASLLRPRASLKKTRKLLSLRAGVSGRGNLK